MLWFVGCGRVERLFVAPVGLGDIDRAFEGIGFGLGDIRRRIRGVRADGILRVSGVGFRTVDAFPRPLTGLPARANHPDTGVQYRALTDIILITSPAASGVGV